MMPPFPTQSTAAAELLGYGEAYQDEESVLAVLHILELEVEESTLYRAALVLLSRGLKQTSAPEGTQAARDAADPQSFLEQPSRQDQS